MSDARDLSGLRMIKILVIDDDRMNCDLLQAVLTRHGYQVLSAISGVEGLNLFRKHSPRITILDLRMPEMDGPGLYQALAQQYPHLCRRTIVFTGDTMSPEVYAFFAEHNVPRLTKPITIAAVRHAIVQALRDAEPAAGHRRAPGAGTESPLRTGHAHS